MTSAPDAPAPSLSPPVWRIRDRVLRLDRPLIIGVLNVTPDSFSDGGAFLSPMDAVAHAQRMVADGADLIDVGGESTRPQGARPVDRSEEWRRVVPVVTALRRVLPHVPISVDTVKAPVAAAALDAGADAVNDVSGFRLDPRMAHIVEHTGAGVVLMHSRGGVHDMGTYVHATYGDDPVADVLDELAASVERATDAGVDPDRIVLDPGLGFAKRSEHSLRMLAELPRLVRRFGRPVLVGASRKRFVGELSGVSDPAARVAGSVGAHVAALLLGARLFRVHDVRAHREALDVAWGVVQAGAAAPVGA